MSLEDLEVVSTGVGANFLGGKEDDGILCWWTISPSVRCLVFAHTLLMYALGGPTRPEVGKLMKGMGWAFVEPTRCGATMPMKVSFGCIVQAFSLLCV